MPGASHRPQVAGDATIVFGELVLAEGAGDLLFGVAHVEIPIETAIGERQAGLPVEEQQGTPVVLQALQCIVGILHHVETPRTNRRADPIANRQIARAPTTARCDAYCVFRILKPNGRSSRNRARRSSARGSAGSCDPLRKKIRGMGQVFT